MTTTDQERPESINVVHFNAHFQSLGGVEAVLKTHYQSDKKFGLNSRFVITQESSTPEFPDVTFLGLTDWANIRSAKNRFRRLAKDVPERCAIYHSNWLLPLFANIDKATRRILVLHSDYPSLAEHLKSHLPYFDGVITVSEELLKKLMSVGLSPSRSVQVPYPISPPPDVDISRPDSKAVLRVGYCGRLEVNQKRVDRLPELLTRIRSRKIPIQFELLGGGPDEDLLRRQIGSHSDVTFLGRRSGLDYWKALQGWDCMVFVSDFEGTPIALLEGMSAGVIPIFPNIGSGGDQMVRSLQTDLVYESGNLDRAAEAIERVCNFPPQKKRALREKARMLVEPHLDQTYLKRFTEFVRRIHHMPSHRTSRPFPQHLAREVLPFKVLRWANHFRRQFHINGTSL